MGAPGQLIYFSPDRRGKTDEGHPGRNHSWFESHYNRISTHSSPLSHDRIARWVEPAVKQQT